MYIYTYCIKQNCNLGIALFKFTISFISVTNLTTALDNFFFTLKIKVYVYYVLHKYTFFH